MFKELMNEIARQDQIHPAGYPYTRDGIRMGIASLQDEVEEVYDEWKLHKRDLSKSDNLTIELYQVAAIAMRMVRSIEGNRCKRNDVSDYSESAQGNEQTGGYQGSN